MACRGSAVQIRMAPFNFLFDSKRFFFYINLKILIKINIIKKFYKINIGIFEKYYIYKPVYFNAVKYFENEVSLKGKFLII